MCLSVVGKVLALGTGGETATVAAGPRRLEVSLAPLVLDDEQVAVGDWLLIHTGLALTVLDDRAASEILAATADLTPPGGMEP